MDHFIRHDWDKEEIRNIYQTPLLELVYRAATLHRRYQDTAEVQVCTLFPSRPADVPRIVPIARRRRVIIPI